MHLVGFMMADTILQWCVWMMAHVFIQDCVRLKHPQLGSVTGEIDILLNLEQFQQAVPSTLACYLSHGTRILFETITIPVSDISGLTENPLSLLTWNLECETLLDLSQEVSTWSSFHIVVYTV